MYLPLVYCVKQYVRSFQGTTFSRQIYGPSVQPWDVTKVYGTVVHHIGFNPWTISLVLLKDDEIGPSSEILPNEDLRQNVWIATGDEMVSSASVDVHHSRSLVRVVGSVAVIK